MSLVSVVATAAGAYAVAVVVSMGSVSAVAIVGA
jgi:hypothetical protein